MDSLRNLLKQITPLRKLVRKVRAIMNPPNNPYIALRKELEQKDKESLQKNPKLIPLHEKLNQLKDAQSRDWNSFVYCDGYFYQGYNRIGINGIKPTEKRMENYQIDTYFSKEKTVLDIGSNSGFLVCYLSDYFKKVDGIELNPFLIEMGEKTADFLDITNVNYIKGDFVKHEFSEKYDVIFSLSNHFTIDGNLNVGFESYIKKVYNNLNKGGILFFESHNINGDDKDLDDKFRIASKYFKLVDYKMVKAFYKADIDKLFAIFIRLDESGEPQELDFELESAKEKYQY